MKHDDQWAKEKCAVNQKNQKMVVTKKKNAQISAFSKCVALFNKTGVLSTEWNLAWISAINDDEIHKL